MANYQEIISACKDIPGGIIEAYHAIQQQNNYLPPRPPGMKPSIWQRKTQRD